MKKKLKEKRKSRNNFETLLSSRRKMLRAVGVSILIGAAAGGVGALYRFTLAQAETLCFFVYDLLRGRLYLLPVWLIILTGIGFLVGFLVKKCPMASGSGIPQVKGIITGYFKDSWLFTLVVKFFAGTAAIVSGMSLGREGPSIQLGANLADGIAKKLAKSRTEHKVFIAGGAGAGLSAAFNAPLSGVMFTLEEIFKYLSPFTLLVTTTAALMSNYVSQMFLGTEPIFNFPVAGYISLGAYWTLIPLGIVTGLCGAGYNYTLIQIKRLYAKIPLPKIAKPLPVFLIAPIAGILFPIILGGGHAIVEKLNFSTGVLFLLAVLILKFIFSIISFSSGAPGGIFFPLLIMGAIIGALFGKFAVFTGLSEELFYNFIILAMAGFFTGIVRAPITGIVLLTEMTGTFDHFLPLSVVCITSYVFAEIAKSKPIYDSLLAEMLDKKEKHKETNEKVIIETFVHVGSRAEDKPISELNLFHGRLIFSVERNGNEITPYGGTILMSGDLVRILCDEGEETSVRKYCEELFETEYKG